VGEAELGGPWKVEACPRGFAVLREWESLERGDVPESVWVHEELALLAAVALSAVGREPLFQLGEEEGPDGFAVAAVYGKKGTQVVGWVRHYHPERIDALHTLEHVARSPAALAREMEAAGPLALEHSGEILGRRMMEP
jgi:hypothetical protein